MQTPSVEKIILEVKTDVGTLIKEFAPGTLSKADTIKGLLDRLYLKNLQRAIFQTGSENKKLCYRSTYIKDLEVDSDGIKRLFVTFKITDEFNVVPSGRSKPSKLPDEESSGPGIIIRTRTFIKRLTNLANRSGVIYKIPIAIPFLLSFIWIVMYQPKENNRICFSETGCFTLDYPWNQRPPFFHFVPQSPTIINVTFNLISRQHSSRTNLDLSTVDSHYWNLTTFGPRDVILIVHGYMDDSSSWIQTMTQAILSVRDAIVIQVDWKRGARMYYPQVVANTRVVGKEIHRLLQALKDKQDNYEIDIVGHSLGAHIASYAAKMRPKLVRRIVDPAFPLFEDYHEDIRLDRIDAEQVLVFHSNVGPFGCGMKNPVGTVDIYLNNGQDQPGCSPMKSFLSQPLNVDRVSSVQDEVACSHRRAYEVFEEFIKSRESFVVYECPSVNHLLGKEREGGCDSPTHLESHRLVDLFENLSFSNKGEGRVFWMPTSDRPPFFLVRTT